MINLVIISGVHGAGKTVALSSFEENGYVIVDNIPHVLLDDFFKSLIDGKYKKVALSIPLEYCQEAYESAKQFKEFNITFLGLYCSESVLLERYKLSRRVHPLEHQGLSLVEAIKKDDELMLKMKEKFTHFIDTSKTSPQEFRKYLNVNIFSPKERKLTVNFISFGYKKSVPQDVEIVFDARLLPNPFWVPALKEKTGLDKEVVNYIFSRKETEEYLKHVTEYLDFYLPKLEESGKKSTTIGIACSGGQHRSVAISEYLKKYYSKRYNTNVSHRDLK
ncbi:MAG: RNase adapter RapZ [Bacilli bacterium]|nr:RNase adapter RapZ [Bacilli bacterium]